MANTGTTTSASTTMPPLQVLPLPREIRDIIYDFALAPVPVTRWMQLDDDYPSTVRRYNQNLNIFAINKATRREAKEALARVETFVLVSSTHPFPADRFNTLGGRWVVQNTQMARLFRGQNYHSLRVVIKLPSDDRVKKARIELGTREPYYVALRVEDLPNFCRALQLVLYQQSNKVKDLLGDMTDESLIVPSSSVFDATIRLKVIPRAGKAMTERLQKDLLYPFLKCSGLGQTVTVAGVSRSMANTLVQRMCPAKPDLEAIAWSMLDAMTALYDRALELHTYELYVDVIRLFEVAYDSWVGGIFKVVPDRVYGAWVDPLLRANAILLDFGAMALTCHLRYREPRRTLDWHSIFIAPIHRFNYRVAGMNRRCYLYWDHITGARWHPEIDRILLSVSLGLPPPDRKRPRRSCLDLVTDEFRNLAAERPASKHIAHDYGYFKDICDDPEARAKFLDESLTAEEILENLSVKKLKDEVIAKTAVAYDYTTPAAIDGWEKKSQSSEKGGKA